jgi:proteasome assembly chaperone 2
MLYAFLFIFCVLHNTFMNRTPTYYIYPPNSPSWDSTPLSTLEKLPISTYSSPISQRPFSAPSVDDPAQIPFIPGGGLTRRIITSLPQHWATPIASILQFVLEGDNRGDAMMMASVVSKVLGFDSTIASNGGWKEPKSWDRGLFGTPHDQTLYG